MASFQAKIGQKRLRKDEKKKNTVLMYSYPTRNRKFQKNSKKFKKSENTIIASFRTKLGWEKLRKRENKKKIVPMCFYPTRNRKFKNNSKRI